MLWFRADHIRLALALGLAPLGHQREQRAPTPNDEAFLEAVIQAGFPEEGRAPSGSWTGLAETWNESREKPITPSALRVRHQRLQQKLEMSQ